MYANPTKLCFKKLQKKIKMNEITQKYDIFNTFNKKFFHRKAEVSVLKRE